jgi:Fe2+ transport system protein FeoA
MVNKLLPTMRSGDSGTVIAVNEVGPGAKRLADMGFVRGARIEMVRSGAPCLVRIDGLCVGLGTGHQRKILVGPH